MAEKRHTNSFFASSAGSPRPMNIVFSRIRRLHLDDNIDLGEIQSPSCNISCHNAVNFSFLELFKGFFPHKLFDIPMKNLSFDGNQRRVANFVDFSFCLAEDDNFPCFSLQKVVDYRRNVCFFFRVIRFQRIMLNSRGSSHSFVFHQIDKGTILSLVSL